MSSSPSTSQVPLTLIRHQGPMITTLGRIALSSVVPLGRPKRNPDRFEDAADVIPPPPAGLVDRYASWSGAGDRYAETLPPHMVSQWSLPLVSKILRQTRYDMASVVNQGVTLRVHGDLPRDEPLSLRASLDRLEEVDGRARVSVLLTTGTQDEPVIVETVLHVSFPLKGAARGSRKPARVDENEWTTIGSWQATKDDGLKFAIITGDFNPIHWIGIAGRRSPFKSTVLHGFGMLVRSFEALSVEGEIAHIDVRFLKPVRLPSERLDVQSSEQQGGDSLLRLVGADDQVHLAGKYGRA